MSTAPTSGSTPPATGGNNTNNGGRTGYQGNRNRNNNNSNASKAKRNLFKGAAGADTALFEKTVTVGHNQATQIVDVLEALVTYCGAKGYGRWAESITDLTRLERALHWCSTIATDIRYSNKQCIRIQRYWRGGI